MTERREWERMVAGELYDPLDAELVRLRSRARSILRDLNHTNHDARVRAELLADLLGDAPVDLVVEPPFHCEYGSNISFGRNVFVNFDCVFLDVAPITIGDNVLIGPAVQLYTATHPLDAAERRSGLEYGRPIRIATDVWIGGAAVVNPGISIGRGTVIGSGSVVTRDIPEGVLAAGNPCRIIRELDPGGVRAPAD